MNRYYRHIILSEIGKNGQEKLANAKVLVIGAGGLGCPVLQYLAAAGIGALGIVDFDNVEESNLQRQVLFGQSSIGKNKAIEAKRVLSNLNNTITIHAYPERLTNKNALQLFESYDIIVDGSDNFETRYLVNDACIISKKPFVFGAIYKFEGQVSVFNYNNGPSYRCLFPNPPQSNSIPNCSETGVLGVLPGFIGSLQANEVLKMILGIGNLLSGKLVCYNLLTLENFSVKVNRNEKTIQNILNSKNDFQLKQNAVACESEHASFSIKDVFLKEHIQIIDVRETHERPLIKNDKIISIPLSNLTKNLRKINRYQDTYIFCQSGIRSQQAVSLLKQHNIFNCFNIKESALEVLNCLSNKSNEKNLKL